MKEFAMNMRIGKLFLISILPLILLNSCNDFFSKTPTDFMTPSQYYTDKSHLNAALVGIYAPLISSDIYGFVFPASFSCVTDEGFFAYSAPDATNDVSYNTQVYTSLRVNNFWKQCYVGIERANNLIANIGNVQNTDSTTLITVLSEAKFLRGYYHYLLVQTFGDIPLKLTPTTNAVNTNYARTPSKQVYEQIIKDMTEAEAGLPVYTNSIFSNAASRVSKTAAEGILARVCLSMAGYPINDKSKYVDALSWAMKVKDSGLHSLLTMADTTANVVNLRGVKLAYPQTSGNPAYKNNGYAQLFLNLTTNKYALKESIWELDDYIQSSSVYTNYNVLGAQIGLNMANDPVLGICTSYCISQQYLYNLYGANDLRRDWAIAPYTCTYSANTAGRSFYAGPIGNAPGSQNILGRCVGKWRREYEPLGNGLTTKPMWNTQINFPLIRYADVLLMICEAEFMINGATQTALDAINQVRRRGYGLDPNTANESVDLTSSTLTLVEIQNERARELCFEGTRRQDLIRWGIYLQRMQDVINFNNTSAYPSGLRSRANVVCQNALNAGVKILLWPIPSSEVLVNTSITQNPGY